MNPWYTLEGSDEETSEVPSDAENALALRSGAAPGNVSAPAVSGPSRPSKLPAASQGQKRPAAPWTLWCKALFIVPHISVWGSSFSGCHPARPPVLASSVLLSSIRPSLTHTSDLFPEHTIISSSHTHTHLVISHLTFTHTTQHLTSHIHTHNTIISSAHTHTQLVISSSDTHTFLLISHIHSQLHLFALLVTPHIRSGRRSLQRLQKGLRRALSPLGARLSPQWPVQSPETAEGAAARVVAAGGPAPSAVAGAVSRDCRRGCGARCRRWGPLRIAL